jgi:molybdenum cofactor cytidylyltransferase
LGKKISAAIFINADQPFLTPEVIDALLQRYRQTLARIVEPRCEDKGGSPVLFDRALFGELTGLRGESGGRQILNAHPDWAERVNISDTRAAIDIDTREDYERARAM